MARKKFSSPCPGRASRPTRCGRRPGGSRGRSRGCWRRSPPGAARRAACWSSLLLARRSRAMAERTSFRPIGVSSCTFRSKAVAGGGRRAGRAWPPTARRPAPTAGCCSAGPTTVGKHELVVARLRHQQLGVAQLDLHVVAGQDVGDVHLEHVGQVLLEQRGGLAFLLRAVVLDARLLLLADAGGDQAVGQAHVHAVDRGPGRAGEHVLRLDRRAGLRCGSAG